MASRAVALDCEAARKPVEIVSLAPGVIDTADAGRGAQRRAPQDFPDVERFQAMNAEGTAAARGRRGRRHPAAGSRGQARGRARSPDLRELAAHRGVIDDPFFYVVAIPAVLLMGISKGGFGSGVGHARHAARGAHGADVRRPRRSCCRSSS